MNSEAGYKIWSDTIPCKNKSVKVTIEFPEQSDLKACQELTDRLKAMYLERIEKNMSLPQTDVSAASSIMEGKKMCKSEMNHE